MGSIPQERRVTRRYPLQIAIVIRHGETEIRGLTRDVSSTGVFFLTDHWPGETGTIEYTLTLPPAITCLQRAVRWYCRGRVLRVERSGEGGRIGVAADIEKCRATSDVPPSEFGVVLLLRRGLDMLVGSA